MKIFFVYRTPREKLLRQYLQGKAPSTFLYGLAELKKLNIDVTLSDAAWNLFNILKYLFLPIEKVHQLLLDYPIGFQFHQTLVLWPRYKSADVIVTVQDSVSLPFLLLKAVGLLPTKIVCISGSIASALEKKPNKLFLRYTRFLFRKADMVICYSEREKIVLEKFIGKRVTFIPLGVDTTFFKSKTKIAPSIDILAVGRDSFRDYATLFEAVKKTPWKVVVVCDPINIIGLSIPKNIRVIHNVPIEVVKELYEKAKLIVIPMKTTNRTQGLVVFMEAAAMNKQIIASDVPGLTTSYNLQKYSGLTLVKPQDPHDLQISIARELKQNRLIGTNTSFRHSVSTMNSVRYLAKNIKELVYKK